MPDRLTIDAARVRTEIERLKLEYPDLAEDAELLADTLEGETDLHEVMTRLVRQVRDAAIYSGAIREEEKTLAERRGRFDRREEMARDMLQSLMEAAGQAKLVLPLATLSIAATAGRPVVDDEAAIPDWFCRFKRSPDMAMIAARIKAGESVPGVHMSNGASRLTVRVK